MQAIGVFDSGYGGLTVLKELVQEMPEYDYLYLGDNARTPYGTRSFETVYEYTLECVEYLFSMNCNLVVLACNTASAKALRTIQQKDLPLKYPNKKVLGVIRPTTEVIGNYTKTKHIGVLGTSGTISSESYKIEIEKFFPEIQVYQEACPMWVPLVENGEYNSLGADYFIKKHLEKLVQQSAKIDTILLACTHYPLLLDKIRQFTNPNVSILSQGKIVAKSLRAYLKRHGEIERQCTKTGKQLFYTTDAENLFDAQAKVFFGKEIKSLQVTF